MALCTRCRAAGEAGEGGSQLTDSLECHSKDLLDFRKLTLAEVRERGGSLRAQLGGWRAAAPTVQVRGRVAQVQGRNGALGLEDKLHVRNEPEGGGGCRVSDLAVWRGLFTKMILDAGKLRCR